MAEPLVGRVAELGALDSALAGLARRTASLLALVGEPGIGKTRLLTELGARAEARGWLVLAGSASELERELPFGVFVDALDEYVHALEPRRLRSVEDSLPALAHVFPSLRAEAAPQLERYRMHRAVRLLLEALAEPRPLVLLLDDVHWADSGSTDLLGALLRRRPAAPVLIGLAARPRQLPERLSIALERAWGAGDLVRIELGALSRDEARELVGDVAAYEESGGNPFYLEQLARTPGRGDGNGAAGVTLGGVRVPRGVAAALSAELALLPDEVRRALEGASVAGDPFEPELAAAAAELPEGVAMEALDELMRRDLVRSTDVPRRFRFRHPLVRRAVYDAAPGGWLLGAHERTAGALAARGAPAAARAHHVERSARHGDMTAVGVLREAGEAATPRAPATAARLFAAALRLLPAGAPATLRVDLLTARAEAHVAAGQFHEAYAAMVECLGLLPEDAVGQRVKLTAGCSWMEHMVGRHVDGHRRLMTAFEELSDASSPEAVELMIQLAVDGFYRTDYESMRDWCQRSLDAARPLGHRTLIASAASTLTLAQAFCGAGAKAEACRREAAALLDGLSDDELARCLDLAGDTLAAAELYLDRFEDAGRHGERTLAVARATGQGQLVPVLFWAGTIRCELGRLQEAADVLEEAVEVARLSDHAEGVGWNLFSRSLVATAAGDANTALTTAEESAEALKRLDWSFPVVGSGLALAEASVLAGEPQRAVDALLQHAGGEELEHLPVCWRTRALELLTRARLALGRPEDAARSAAAARALADDLGLRMAIAMADRAHAAVALAAGDFDSAAEHALAAAAAADEVGAPVEGARSRVLAGQALAAAGDAARAITELERAAGAFDAVGAVHRRDAAERELRRLGHRRLHRRTRPGSADAGIESLTERELQIARLIVDRKTNPQIAAELYLSRKTVETHVRNLFNKLDVSSRVDVARVVQRADRLAG